MASSEVKHKSYEKAEAAVGQRIRESEGMDRLPSLVMNEINSETHSCMHSFASFAIFAFSGNADFIILATGAKLRMLASCSPLLDEEERFACCCAGD
jgi:hypothetical protein